MRSDGPSRSWPAALPTRLPTTHTRSDHVRGTDGFVDSRIQPPKAFYAVSGPDEGRVQPIARRQHSPVLPDAPAAKLSGDQAQSSASKLLRLRRRLRRHRFRFLT